MARKSRKYANVSQSQSPTTGICYAGAYVRLSVEDEHSIINQEQLIRQFMSQHDDLVLSRLYVDDGRSSFIGSRPEFDRMIADAKSKEINCIIVKDFSRFGRDYIDLGDYLEQLFPVWGTRFISILDDYDSEGIHGHTNFTSALKGIINASYSRDISSKVKSTVRLRQQQGTYIPAKVPYGYIKSPDSGVILNLEAAETVRRIFALALEEKSAYMIAGLLNQSGVPSPGTGIAVSNDISKRPIWTRNKVMSILQDQSYIGCIVMGKTENLNWYPRRPVKRPAYDWLVVPNHHEAIVSVSDFNDVQMILDARKRVQLNEIKPSLSSDSYLGSRLYCGDCGRKMKRRIWKGVTYFVCPRNTEADGACSPKSIKADVLKYDIWETIQLEVEKSKQYHSKKLVYENSPKYRLKRAYLDNQIDQLHSQVAALDKSKFTFYTAKFDSHYSQSDLQLFMNLFDLQKSALNKEREKIYSQLSDYDDNIAANSSQFFTLLEYAEIEELTPTMFEEMVDRVYCYDGKVDIILRVTVPR